MSWCMETPLSATSIVTAQSQDDYFVLDLAETPVHGNGVRGRRRLRYAAQEHNTLDLRSRQVGKVTEKLESV